MTCQRQIAQLTIIIAPFSIKLKRQIYIPDNHHGAPGAGLNMITTISAGNTDKAKEPNQTT